MSAPSLSRAPLPMRHTGQGAGAFSPLCTYQPSSCGCAVLGAGCAIQVKASLAAAALLLRESAVLVPPCSAMGLRSGRARPFLRSFLICSHSLSGPREGSYAAQDEWLLLLYHPEVCQLCLMLWSQSPVMMMRKP